jgi:hypothetical protein
MKKKTREIFIAVHFFAGICLKYPFRNGWIEKGTGFRHSPNIQKFGKLFLSAFFIYRMGNSVVQ